MAHMRNVDFDRLPLSVAEIIALNLRKICELVAFGCAAAMEYHLGDGPKQGYEADKLIRRVLARHPQCFPIPVDIAMNFETRIHSVRPVQGDVPGPEAVISLYRDVSNLLHQHNPNKAGPSQECWKPKLKEYRDCLRSLLLVHMVPLKGRTFVCTLGYEEGADAVVKATGPARLFAK